MHESVDSLQIFLKKFRKQISYNDFPIILPTKAPRQELCFSTPQGQSLWGTFTAS